MACFRQNDVLRCRRSPDDQPCSLSSAGTEPTHSFSWRFFLEKRRHLRGRVTCHDEPNLDLGTQERQLVISRLNPMPVREHSSLSPSRACERDGDILGRFRRNIG